MHPAVPPEVRLTDGHLVLRRQHPDDLEMHLAATDDEQMDWLWEPGDRAKWETLTSQQRRDHQKRHLQGVHDSFGPGPKWCFSVDAPAARYVVYIDCDLANPHVPPGEANISYACHPAHRGRGYTAAAVRLVCEFLRVFTTASEAHIVVDRLNSPSIGVAHSVGALQQGLFVDEHGRMMIRYVLTLRPSPQLGAS